MEMVATQKNIKENTMKRVMRENKGAPQLTEEASVHISQRNQRADRLVEKWSKIQGLQGKKMVEKFDENPGKIRNLAIVLENQENLLQSMTETQISNAFSTNPENVMRIIRLGYPNSIRGDVFLDWAMETAHDSIYYLYPKYGKTKRGTTAGDYTIETAGYRGASEKEEESDVIGPGDASTTAFSGTIANPPLRPWSVSLWQASNSDWVQIATDDGSGNLTGTLLDSTAVNTINYTTGAMVINFTTAPIAALTFLVQYNFDSEESDQYADIQSIELVLKDYQFRAKPWPLTISWSKMLEILLGTVYKIDTEEQMIQGAAEELKKSLDFFALKLGYRTSLKNSAVTFDIDGATGESEIDRAQALTRAIDDAGDVMYDSILRGGVSKIYGGPKAVSYTKLLHGFSGTGKQPAIGGYKVGVIDDSIDLFKVPSAIVPTDELVCVYKNEQNAADVSIAFGILYQLYSSNAIEFKELYSERGVASYGDQQVLQSKYIVRIKLSNLT